MGGLKKQERFDTLNLRIASCKSIDAKVILLIYCYINYCLFEKFYLHVGINAYQRQISQKSGLLISSNKESKKLRPVNCCSGKKVSF